MPDWVRELLNYGPLGLFAAGVCWMVYKGLRHGGTKALDIGERYVASTEKLHDTLRETIDKQQTLCQGHHEILATHDDRMRQAALAACKMCREISQKDLPNSADAVGRHCDQIEQILRAH